MDPASRICVSMMETGMRAVVEESTRISNCLSSTLCNSILLMNRSLQVQTPRTGANADYNHHLKHPLLQKGHSHAIQRVNFLKETRGLTTRHHSPWRSRTDTPFIPRPCVPAQGPWRQFTLEDGVLGTELYSVPPSTFCDPKPSDILKHLSAKMKTPKKTQQLLT